MKMIPLLAFFFFDGSLTQSRRERGGPPSPLRLSLASQMEHSFTRRCRSGVACFLSWHIEIPENPASCCGPCPSSDCPARGWIYESHVPCRHTTATALALGNIAPSVIQEVMRHTKFNTTQHEF